MSLYLRPSTLAEALDCLARAPCPLAGGTDLYPATKAAELPGDLTDLSGLADLRGITPLPGGGLRIGACTTWTEIALAPLPPALHALQVAARAVGGRQIQTAGTIGGNLCNASPAADGVPPLLVTDAEVEVLSPGGTRRMALADFITGPRRTALVPGELLVAIHIPGAGLQWGSSFQKLGARAYLVISIAMVAARVVWRDGLMPMWPWRWGPAARSRDACPRSRPPFKVPLSPKPMPASTPPPSPACFPPSTIPAPVPPTGSRPPPNFAAAPWQG